MVAENLSLETCKLPSIFRIGVLNYARLYVSRCQELFDAYALVSYMVLFGNPIGSEGNTICIQF